MKLISVILCMLLIGCQKPYRAEFVRVVLNHRSVTIETVNSLVASIDDRLNEPVTAQQRTDLENLRDRLFFISSSSSVIERYVLEIKMDETLLQELLRHIWKGELDELP